MKKAKIILGVSAAFLGLLSCSNHLSNRATFICERGSQKIEIKIENDQDFLIYNQPTRTNFTVTNIDPVQLRIAGPGIKLLGTNKNKTSMQTEIKVMENYIDNDTLSIKVWYGSDEEKRCDFKIPVKRAE